MVTPYQFQCDYIAGCTPQIMDALLHHNLTEVLDAISELETLRHGFPFEMDGAVIKVNDRTLYPVLGATAKAPRWARAFKYAPEQAETVIEAISIQVGRSGVLTPGQT